ncbi:MAG: substrate-binding domain-containing protein [Planctomycetota bacterium]|jgi:rhamnose transport system substrate-binding protein|nr:substrate-binding domain-containing protein [Planctomycetota bacterium]
MNKKIKILLGAVALAIVAVVAVKLSAGKNPPAPVPVAAANNLCVYFIPKNMGNPYFDAISSGFYHAFAEIGEENFTYKYVGPDVATDTSQVPYIEEAANAGAAAIFIAINSDTALDGLLDQVRARGTRVYFINQDTAPATKQHRDAAIMPVNFATVGSAQIELLASQLGYAGKFAILSATPEAPDQNAWIETIKNQLDNNPAYAKMELVEIVYGDDQSGKSTVMMKSLLEKYPDLNGVIAPTAVGLPAACAVLEREEMAGKITITGLGLPSEMARFVRSGTCQAFHLWTPPDEGYIAGYLVWAEKKLGIAVKPGATFPAGKLGNYTVRPNGQILALEAPMLYNAANIEKYAVQY